MSTTGSSVTAAHLAQPDTTVSRWLRQGGRLDTEHETHHRPKPWYMVLWLTGVDYFSTLGYQPGIALLAAGAIAPFATSILVLVTLLCALPIYAQVARRSYAGQGSIAMLENLLPGWLGKIFVLIMLGFAATDFVITMTLSAADAAEHAIKNPFLHQYLGEAQVPITIGLLVLLACVFLKGFTEALGLAAAVAVPYLLLNVVVLIRALVEVFRHPEALALWNRQVSVQGDWAALLFASVLIFPRLALGLSGFETGVSVMPLVDGGPEDRRDHVERNPRPPMGRIRATRKLLAAAAIIMSCFLLLSSFTTTVLIPPEAYQKDGPAAGRAIAYLAHNLLGSVFGSIYDFSTILILWFAGASAMAGLLHLIPRYLPRFGMAPKWVAYSRPLVLFLLGIDIVVTVIFHADVEAQGGAYATGVLALMLSAAIAAALSLWHEGKKSLAVYCWGVAGVFAFTFIDNVHARPDGVIISLCFIAGVIVIGAFSRYRRATELRISEVNFCDTESKKIWGSILGKKVNLVPIRTESPDARRRKAEEIRRHYCVSGPLAFIHVKLLDNRSDFMSPLMIEVTRDGDDVLIEATQAIAIANSIAYLSELIDPISIFLGLTRQNLVSQSMRYLFFGEGETGLMVYTILLKYWEWTPEEDVRPLIHLMSD